MREGLLGSGEWTCLVTTATSPQAREMTLQAMALQQQPLSAALRSLPTEVSLACLGCRGCLETQAVKRSAVLL